MPSTYAIFSVAAVKKEKVFGTLVCAMMKRRRMSEQQQSDHVGDAQKEGNRRQVLNDITFGRRCYCFVVLRNAALVKEEEFIIINLGSQTCFLFQNCTANGTHFGHLISTFLITVFRLGHRHVSFLVLYIE